MQFQGATAPSTHSGELDSKIAASGTAFATDVSNFYNRALADSATWTPGPNWFVVTSDPGWIAAHRRAYRCRSSSSIGMRLPCRSLRQFSCSLRRWDYSGSEWA